MQDVVTKYMRTLAVVKRTIESVRHKDTIELEDDSALTKDDRDFRVYMASGKFWVVMVNV